MNKNNTKRLLTEREAMDFLQCSRTTLYRLRKAGMIKFIQMGSRIRYRMQDLEEYLDANSVENSLTLKNINNEKK
jgi:excisionase family DNA binding protein